MQLQTPQPPAYNICNLSTKNLLTPVKTGSSILILNLQGLYFCLPLQLHILTQDKIHLIHKAGNIVIFLNGFLISFDLRQRDQAT